MHWGSGDHWFKPVDAPTPHTAPTPAVAPPPPTEIHHLRSRSSPVKLMADALPPPSSSAAATKTPQLSATPSSTSAPIVIPDFADLSQGKQMNIEQDLMVAR